MNYDVVIVGTGAGGSTAMKILGERGLRVLALNSGPPVGTGDFKHRPLSFELPYRGLPDPAGVGENYESETDATRHLYEKAITYTRAPGTQWKWTRCVGVGGKANFWGRSCPRFAPIDFSAASIDGIDVDWPVSYDEIAPYYTRIERLIGVASTVQKRASNPDGEYLPPIPLRYFDYILQRAAGRCSIPYLPDRIAQLTVPHGTHPKCHFCGGCTSGCPTGACFSPVWYFIPDAVGTGNVEIRTNAYATNIIVDRKTGLACGAAYIDRHSGREIEVRARAVILAASCCETAKIMLNSRSHAWPNGIANSSGQVGRNLSDQLYADVALGVLPQLFDAPSRPDNVSNSSVAWMPRWQNLSGDSRESFARGYSVYPMGGCGDVPSFEFITGFGSGFKQAVKREYPAGVGFLTQIPSLPSPSNYVDLDPNVRDIYGVPAARFHFSWGPNELSMLDHAAQTCAHILRTAGGEIRQLQSAPAPPGTSLHETGTCRFGNDPRKFVTDRFGFCHDVPNLAICDGSIFPYTTDKTPTLSILAFALRTCEEMADRFIKKMI